MNSNSGGITCGKCKTLKACSEFAPSAAARGNGYCRECHQSYYARKRDSEGRTYLYSYTKRRRAQMVQMVAEHKAAGGCKYCGESHPAALDLHHRDADSKVDGVRKMIDDCRPRAVIEAEMEKCDIVCANCHRKLHYAKGGTAYWSKDKRYAPEVIAEANLMREKRMAQFPVTMTEQ